VSNGEKRAATEASATRQSPPLLRVSNLSKTFPGQRALDGVDFEIYPGEICALLGQNGSGKSTVIKVLAGYHDPDPGAVVQFEGGPEHDLGDRSKEWRSHLRFIHQDLGLVDALDSLDNLAIGPGFTEGSKFKRIRWRQQAATARELLAELGVEFDVRMPVGRLSAVERTMLAVARALRGFADRHGILILDEPTASLSAPEVERLFTVLRQLESRGIAILFVSHRLDEVYDLAERAIILREGRLVAAPTLHSTAKPELIDMITGGSDRQPQAISRQLGETMLSVRNLAGRRARDVSFDLRSGEVLGVAGLDGSGRDELAGLIFRGDQIDGTVSVAGGDPVGLGPSQAKDHGIAYVPADRAHSGIVQTMNCAENLTLTDLGPFFKGAHLNRRLERQHVLEWMQRVEVRPPDPARMITTFSGGNQQKLLLAKWLRTEPRILMLEEPTQGIDIEAKQTVLELVERAAAEGVAVLLTSSEAEDLVAVCDRVLVLRDGVISAELRGSETTVGEIIAQTLRDESSKEPANPNNGRTVLHP